MENLILKLVVLCSVLAFSMCQINLHADVLCKQVCNRTCEHIDIACRVASGLQGVCDNVNDACSSQCDRSCTCLDDCQFQCGIDFDGCLDGGTVADGVLCLVTRSVCEAFCFPKCDIRTGQGPLTAFVRSLG